MVLSGKNVSSKDDDGKLFTEGAQLDFVMGNQDANLMDVGTQRAQNKRDAEDV